MADEAQPWTSVDTVMVVFLCQGFVITILNIPLLIMLTMKRKNRERKEFVLIGIVCFVDFFYVAINCINSYHRLITPVFTMTRLDCVTQPFMFTSLVATQLVAGMPLMIAIDRFIASFFGVFYYKQSVFYSVIICLIPIIFGFFITSLNSVIVATTPSQNTEVSSMCFTSTLPAPIFKLTFHGFKWAFIIIAAIIYGAVSIILVTKTGFKLQGSKRISKSHRVMGLTTVNAILFHLVPDALLVFPPDVSNPIVFNSILYSLILNKILFNFILYMIFHKELRGMYVSLIYRKHSVLTSSSTGHSVRIFTARKVES